MPKEYVGDGDGSITVRWGRDDGIIQLSVAGPVGWRERFVEPRGKVDLDNGLDWHLTIKNRWEINRLIRLLRTARDASFGKDA